MSKICFIQPDPQDWGILKQIADIDAQAFGSDGISVFNLAQFTRSGAVSCIVDGDTVVAEAVLLRNVHDAGAIVFGFAVAVSQHGKGMGTLLIEHLITLAVDAGITYLELTFNPDNPSAKRLYMEKAGFYKKAELSAHPQKGEPRWLLRLDLKQS